MKYALVCVDIKNEAVDKLFYYSIPDHLLSIVQPGMRATVPFGSRSNPIDGFIIALSDDIDMPVNKTVKPLLELNENYPIFSAEMLELAQWMKDKYYTTLANC